jgi:hypothetical protein
MVCPEKNFDWNNVSGYLYTAAFTKLHAEALKTKKQSDRHDCQLPSNNSKMAARDQLTTNFEVHVAKNDGTECEGLKSPSDVIINGDKYKIRPCAVKDGIVLERDSQHVSSDHQTKPEKINPLVEELETYLAALDGWLGLRYLHLFATVKDLIQLSY